MISIRQPTREDILEAAIRSTTDWFIRRNILFHDSAAKTQECNFCRPQIVRIRREYRRLMESS
jgi:hypothetical protein